MEFEVAEGKAFPRKEIRSFRGRNRRSLKNNLLESIEQADGVSVACERSEDGAVRMKLLVRKQDFRQMLELVKAAKNNVQTSSSCSSSLSLSVEHRLNLLRRKQLSRANAVKERHHRSWTPALQSIPE